jgi:hypothetical protein
MTPFQFKDEVLILPVGAQGTGGNAGTMDHAITDRPGRWGAVDIDPPVEGGPIEQIHPVGFLSLRVCFRLILG